MMLIHKVQSELYKAMLDHGVFMEGALLKSNMVNPGKDCTTSYSVEQIAKVKINKYLNILKHSKLQFSCLYRVY